MTAADSTGPAGPEAASGGAALAEVTRVLASYRAPRLPPRLAARLDQALAAEVARGRWPVALAEAASAGRAPGQTDGRAARTARPD